MSSILGGSWAIESVLINDHTVLNCDTIRGLEILDDEWVLRPSGQRFRIRQSSGNTAVLESDGEVYFADYDVNGSTLNLRLSRQNIKETLTIEAIAITADVYVKQEESVSQTN